jgi:3-oxoacyl-[acyl-carrier-protein] synthase-3
MNRQAVIKTIEYYLPERIVSNDELAAEFPSWTPNKISEKTGIEFRHVVAPDECSSDLAVAAAMKVFSGGTCSPNDIDYILFCTQSPDYFLPTTACLIQERLKIPNSCGALDFNLGCSGYVYGLGLAKGLIESGQAMRVLLITAETYSKFMNPQDRSVRTLFGDAATATVIESTTASEIGHPPFIGPFVFGTDGSGGKNLIVPSGGMRKRFCEKEEPIADDNGNFRTSNDLYMNGGEIFTFTLRVVPQVVKELLHQANYCLDDIDLFVFHQANQFMLDHLRKKLCIPSDRFYISLKNQGNTVSSTIPIALKEAKTNGILKPGHKVMIVGFGVGYSWSAAMLQWLK